MITNRDNPNIFQKFNCFVFKVMSQITIVAFIDSDKHFSYYSRISPRRGLQLLEGRQLQNLFKCLKISMKLKKDMKTEHKLCHLVPGSIPTEGNFFCWIYFALPRKPLLPTLPKWSVLGKTQLNAKNSIELIALNGN